MINYNEIPTQNLYAKKIAETIAALEGDYIHQATNIGDDFATIGFGYTFNRANNVALWSASGIILNATDLAILEKIDNASADERTNIAISEFTRNITKSEATLLLEQTYPEYEGPANDLNMPLSYERISFVSITYNRGETAVREKMADFFSAIKSGNRAEAWYQIRYNAQTTNSLYKNGIAKRRYAESEIFGLYDNNGINVSKNEALSVYQMYTRHRTEILDYENQFSVQVYNANIGGLCA